jgi:hypothetical protein
LNFQGGVEGKGIFMRINLYTISITASAFFAVTESAFAQAAVPGPIAAVGAPALLLIGGAFVAVRYLRSRHK